MTSYGSLQHNQPESLEDARIKELPSDAFYIPDFITPDEEEQILKKVQSPCSCAL